MRGLKGKEWFMGLEETTLGDPLLLVQYSIHLLSDASWSAKFLFTAPPEWFERLLTRGWLLTHWSGDSFICSVGIEGFRQQLSQFHPADWQVSGRLCRAGGHFTTRRSAKGGASYLQCLSHSTHSATSSSLMTFSIQCDLLWLNTNLTSV